MSKEKSRNIGNSQHAWMVNHKDENAITRAE
jgi:hypothetical protein